MKCPNCGKKMKKNICKKCGYDPAAKQEAPVLPTSMRVNYYTYDPANPSLVYPMAVTGEGMPNPALASMVPAKAEEPAAPLTKKEAKKAMKATKKAQKKALKGLSRKEKKAAKKANKKANKATKKANKKAIKANKKAMKVAKKAAKKKINKNTNVNGVVAVPARKSGFCRFFAIIVTGVCAAALAVLSFSFITALPYVGSDLVPTISESSLLTTVLDIVKSDVKVLNAVPAFFDNGRTGIVYNLSIYVFALFTVLAALHAVFAIFSKDKARKRVRKALFLLGVGALLYSIALITILGRGGEVVVSTTGTALISVADYHIDLPSMLIGVVCLTLFSICWISDRKCKKCN